MIVIVHSKSIWKNRLLFLLFSFFFRVVCMDLQGPSSQRALCPLLAFEGQILRELPGWWAGHYFSPFHGSSCLPFCHHVIFLFRTNYYGHIVCLLRAEHKALLNHALTNLTSYGFHSLPSECVSMHRSLSPLIRIITQSRPLIPHS